jgi:S-(hydroxymethyl)glutathione dehydrogenase / alcohol dehydrogenase
MRAAVLRNTGDETLDVVDDMEVTDPGPGEVTIKIEATGVCHSDLSAMTGVIPQPAPAVLGHEGAGIISKVGPGVTSVAEGDHVIVAWSPPCGKCINCTTRHSPHLCAEIMMNKSFLPRFLEGDTPVFGMAGAGTFAEYTTMPEEAAIKIDDDVPFEIASLIGCGVTTGVGAAINTAKVSPGSSVVVFGCGGVGIAAIQGSRVAGAATIVAVDLVDRKLEDAKRFGATHACKPDDLDALKAELTGDGFDYAFEAIGLPITIRAAYDAVRRGGVACIIGVGGMDKEVSFNAFEVFYSEKTFKGSYYGSADVRGDFHRLLRLWKSGQLDLEGMITRVIKLDDINDALAQMKAGEVIRQVITF